MALDIWIKIPFQNACISNIILIWKIPDEKIVRIEKSNKLLVSIDCPNDIDILGMKKEEDEKKSNIEIDWLNCSSINPEDESQIPTLKFLPGWKRCPNRHGSVDPIKAKFESKYIKLRNKHSISNRMKTNQRNHCIFNKNVVVDDWFYVGGFLFFFHFGLIHIDTICYTTVLLTLFHFL